MGYTTTNWTSAGESFSGIIGVANSNSGGHFWLAIVIMVFLVLLITFSSMMVPEGALLASAFLAMLLSLLLVYMGVVAYWVLGVFVGIIIVMIMYIVWSNRWD